VTRHFIPVALDTYFRGNSQELAFCEKIRAGGNHVVVATAGGRTLGEGREQRLRKQELSVALAEYQKLPERERKPELPDPKKAIPARRPVPAPPPGGLIVRGYCTYMRQQESKFVRSREFYYKENPDRWAAETQSDMLWLTREEWQSLVPAEAKVGSQANVAEPIQQRFFSTIAIDYMEGSVNSLPPRAMTMTLTVEQANAKAIHLRLDGHAELGKRFDVKLRGQPNTRGCEVRVLGYLTYNRQENRFTRFDLVGIGQAWGQKRNDRRAIRIADYPWNYGIACELVQGKSPIDLIPPYNLLHYGSAGPYFGKK
jgi:hypothetical protein